jgi:hypothetical protein
MLLNDYGGSMDCRGRGSTKAAVEERMIFHDPYAVKAEITSKEKG